MAATATYGSAVYGSSTYARAVPPAPISSVTTWEFLVEDVMANGGVGQLIGALPLNDVVYAENLNRPGSLTATLPLSDADEHVDLLDAGRRAIYVVRNGVIEWGGLLTDPTVPVGGDVVNITCVGWPGWFDRRDIWIDRQFSATDQFQIFKTLVDDAQDETVALNGPGANLNLSVVWNAPSGVLRDRLQEYRYFSGKNLGAALRDLAALDNGFDFRMRYLLGAESMVKQVVLSYPQAGADRSRDADGNAVVGFEYVRDQRTNIVRRGLQTVTSKMAWRVRGWGSGADTARLLSTQVNEDRRGVYPFYDGQAQLASVITQDVLDDNTLIALATNDHPIVLPLTEVDPAMYPRWGTYDLGDIWNVNIDDGYCSASGPHRFIGYKMDAKNDLPTLLWQADA